VTVEGWEEPGYVHPENVELADAAAAGELRPVLTTLLSPFDPLVWDRARALELFGFDYRLECYTPAPKRRYGYFTLPILRRGELVGRLDAKAHRREGRFEIRALFLEPGVRVSDALVRDLARSLRECATWHGTPEITLGSTTPPRVGERIEEALCVA
ncbi:MAG TPA: crosslink repair DNA glycosylase YcaQ family protein, partial [Longimicrobiaceae bacterium]|nr:crosslink repair DNA glycosylase YcaQ family protein [Longimicrobiaceae bacterium]